MLFGKKKIQLGHKAGNRAGDERQPMVNTLESTLAITSNAPINLSLGFCQLEGTIYKIRKTTILVPQVYLVCVISSSSLK